ncbi:putative B3 domain-containing protein [Panicum miliaceum]|uniref:B3 domain-containing protein n=1 Tax=Panicum miliaceum TaxID=4540 RepID=A0A3L6Q5T3_PANMI|nr:putative B3 domain-containing protein [Panicum miliaceum]
MASPGNQGAAKAKHLRLLLPFTCDTLRIPDEVAAEIGAEEALIVGPAGGKVIWPVEVGQDGDGAFLGRGWPEFAEACGVGAGWFLVLRHRGRGVLSAKAFDATFCFRELGGAPAPPAVEATASSKYSTHKPKFIRVLPRDFMKKMLIPPKFVQQYIPKELLDNRMAIILGPIGKVYNIKLEMGHSGVFFAGGWSQFLVVHDITEANSLLLRYEGNMVFTVKVFEPDGYQREAKHKENRVLQISTLPHIQEQQEAPSASIQKQLKNNLPTVGGEKKPQDFRTSLDQTSFKKRSVYEIGPPSWIEKQINANTLKRCLVLPNAFCDAIGLRERCTITLKTSSNGSGSWQVHGYPCKDSSYLLEQGWRRFCLENNLKEGDICTFNVIESTMWHVNITRCLINTKCKSRNGSISSEDQNKRKGSITSLKSASSCPHGVYEIGPPAWVKKEISTGMIRKYISIPAAFCDAIGLREACTITFKTSLNSTSSWQVRVLPYKNTSHQVGSGWKRFCRENDIKEGDVCTFNIVQTLLWHVVVDRC